MKGVWLLINGPHLLRNTRVSACSIVAAHASTGTAIGGVAWGFGGGWRVGGGGCGGGGDIGGRWHAAPPPPPPPHRHCAKTHEI